MERKIFVVLVMLSLSLRAQSPSTPAPTQSAPTPQAKEDDVRSIDSILAATYDVISGSAGKKRDWDRFRSLFYPGARLIPTGKRPNETEVRSRVLTPDDYVERSAPFLEKEGFFERGVSNKVEKFGNIAHVFSTYESRIKADGPVTARGINSIEAYWDGKRWWIASAIWDDERPDNPLPPEYLPAKAGSPQ